MSIQRRLNALAASLKLTFFTVTGSAIMAGGLIILQAWLLSVIIDGVHLQGADLDASLPVLGSLTVVVILRAVLVFVNEQSAAMLSNHIRSGLREILTAKILRLGPAYRDRQQSGELSYALTGAIESLDAYFSQFMPQLVIAAVLPLGILAVVFPLDALSGLVLLLTAPLIPIFMILVGKTTEALTRKQYSTFSRMSAFFLDSLRGLAELKNLGRSREHTSRLDRVSESYRQATMRVLQVSFLSALVLELAATLSVAVIAVEIGIRLLYAQIDFRQAFFLLVIAPEFYLPLRQVGARFHASQNGVSAARRIFEILDQPEPEHSVVTRSIPDLFTSPFTIRFESVSFVYPDRTREALRNVSFEIHSGKTVALAGLNGSGKSTLAALLMRFIQPVEGVIYYNGMDIQSINIADWRAGMAHLDQQPVLFNDTVRENLLITRPGASDKELNAALKAAQLSTFIATLPLGLDTALGENAYRFSGGQAQRLGLARAFLKNAPLLVLDEPTSHLDSLLENELDESVSRLSRGRTCLIIAHRKDTVRRADRVIMLENGRVVCSGSHNELKDCSNAYAALFAGEEA
jgi:ATP-binding cassette, subfamily C, bacterial CydD